MDISVKDLLNKEIGTTLNSPVSYEIGDLNGEVLIKGPVDGSLKITKLEDRLLVDFDLKVKVGLTCVRCLNKYLIDLPLKFEQTYYFLPDVAKDEDSLKVKKDFTIDITEPIRQEILVRVPMQPLCRSGCKGLCPYCGQDLKKKNCRCRKSKEESPFSELRKIKRK